MIADTYDAFKFAPDNLILMFRVFIFIGFSSYLVAFKIISHLNESTFILISRLYHAPYIIIYTILYIMLIEIYRLTHKDVAGLKRS